MAATTANEDNISLKVMVHKQENRVIFAEADSNFVDTLFSFMTLPMATIVRLLKKCPNENLKVFVSLTNLHQSLMDLSLNHFCTEESKFMMLSPRSSSFDHCRKLKLNIDDTDQPIANYFICQNVSCSQRVGPIFSTCNFARCSYCGMLMNREGKGSTVNNTSQVACFDGSVFVCDGLTFIITDDLRVMPKTSDSTILLLHGLGITDASQLEERTIDISHQQILTLLKLALSFKNPMTKLVFPSVHHIQYSVDVRQGLSVQNLVMSNGIGTNAKKMMLKVAFQKSTSKFLFAEADEDFVEFVFGFLEIPLGTVISKLMMSGSTSVDGFDNLFRSISNMRVGKYIKSQDLKDMLLNPQLEQKNVSQYQIFSLNVANSSLDQQGYCAHMTCSTKTSGGNLKKPRRFKSRKSSRSVPQAIISTPTESKDSRVQESFLKSPVKFMLTDDLVITPISFISAIALLNKLNVPVDDVEEHELSIGIEEGLKILKAGLKSSSTLSDALLNGKS